MCILIEIVLQIMAKVVAWADEAQVSRESGEDEESQQGEGESEGRDQRSTRVIEMTSALTWLDLLENHTMVLVLVEHIIVMSERSKVN